MFDSDYVKKWGKGPFVTVDVVLYDTLNRFLLIQRQNGQWANPGGFVDPEEELIDAAKREMREETGVDLDSIHARMPYSVQAFTSVNRDPRARIITFAHYFIVLDLNKIEFGAGDDAKDARIFRLDEIQTMDLYGDHKKIIEMVDYLD